MRLWSGSQLWVGLVLLASFGCGTTREAAVSRPARRSANVATPPAQKPAAPGLYAADEALRDALSGSLEYLGTGAWPGISRMRACVFRNQRVLIVNVYCSITEQPAFRLDIYSPTRGHVRLYAEASGPVSVRSRRDYFTFTAESEQPPGPAAHLPPLSLAMSFAELRSYDERRYHAYLPACYGGQELSRQRSGCLGALSSLAPEWSDRNELFLEVASSEWYRLVREMRALALRYGRDPE